MILILGGTTEGRIAVRVVDEAGSPYYYSTRGKEQEIICHNGTHLTGALDAPGMTHLCRQKGIRLLIDAAHPFATELHRTVAEVAHTLSLPFVRFDRVYSNHHHLDSDIQWCSNYEEVLEILEEQEIHHLLALTGVQTIAKLEAYWRKPQNKCHFRILDRESSRAVAAQAGFPEKNLAYYHPGEEERKILQAIRPQAVLLKENGLTGGFEQKLEAAREEKVTIIALEHPQPPPSDRLVNGEHGLRRAIEQYLPDFFPLRSGLTTGASAAAAARAAFAKLLHSRPLSSPPMSIPLTLPNGETFEVTVNALTGSATPNHIEATATIFKDGGDDPDATNSLPIVVTVSMAPSPSEAGTLAEEGQPLTIILHGGEGIGTVTLPGLGIEIGQPAINATPRKMIEENLQEELAGSNHRALRTPIHVTISVPGGEEVAMRTFNPRLGIVGGISIIGTSGIVKPFSSEAFVNSIRKSMEVAQATGSPRIVINSGAKSEKYVRSIYPDLPSQAFVHYGNLIGETLKIAAELSIKEVTLGVMIGKAVKLAEGHLDTHSKKVTMNKEFLKEIARQAGCSPATADAIESIALARELWTLLPKEEVRPYCSLLMNLCHKHCAPLLPQGTLTLLLITEEGEVAS